LVNIDFNKNKPKVQEVISFHFDSIRLFSWNKYIRSKKDQLGNQNNMNVYESIHRRKRQQIPSKTKQTKERKKQEIIVFPDLLVLDKTIFCYILVISTQQTINLTTCKIRIKITSYLNIIININFE
jgi:hypothetical protein